MAILTLTSALYSIDCAITDRLYAGLAGPSSDIIIIGVDEETLEAYGNYNTFIRQKCGELTNILFKDSETAPAVLGIDILFVDNVNEETDKYLAEAVTNADRVVNSCNLVYRGALSRQEDGSLYYDTDNISFVEMPFDSLLQNNKTGFVNVSLAKDGIVRYALDAVEYKDEATGESCVLPSFARRVYEEYCDYMGMEKEAAVSDDANRFGIRFSGKSGEYSHVSLKDVLEYLRRRKTLEVFSKYVAPEVVRELTRSGDFKLVLGGEKRNVAVLFVDIRGFTPLSEILSIPQQGLRPMPRLMRYS